MKILVTDITNLSQQICVAGWCGAEGRMIRPLSDAGGSHWTPILAGQHLFELGNIVELQPTGAANNRGLPHQREDLVVVPSPRLIGNLTGEDLTAALAISEAVSVAALFQGHLQSGAFVAAGSDCASLGAVRVAGKNIKFWEKDREKGPQLRCNFRDMANQWFDFPVVSRNLQNFHKQGGLDALGALYADRDFAHIRIGLAHPFDNGRCYAMVNNVFFF